MDFGGILEQRLHHHDPYHHQHLEAEASKKAILGFKNGASTATAGKMDGIYEAKVSFSAFAPPAAVALKGGASGVVDHLSRLSLVPGSNEDDVEDEEVTRATHGRDRRSSPPPGAFLLGGSTSIKGSTMGAMGPPPPPAKKASHMMPLLPPPAPAMGLTNWQSLPPGHSANKSSTISTTASSSNGKISMRPSVTGSSSSSFNVGGSRSISPNGTSGQDEGRPRLWTPEEDALLRAAMELHKGRNWKMIAEGVPNRTSVQCLQRWKHVLHPEVGKGSWTAEEDEELVRLVGIYGQRWSEISRHMPKRIGKRCRERWENHLKAGLRKDRWSQEEERVLLEARERLGNHWTGIAKLLEGRSVNQCKNHWYSISRRVSSNTATTTGSSSRGSVPKAPAAAAAAIPTPKVQRSPPQVKQNGSPASAYSSSSLSMSSSSTSSLSSPLEASGALLALATGAVEILASSSRSTANTISTTSTATKRQLSPRHHNSNQGQHQHYAGYAHPSSLVSADTRPSKTARTADGVHSRSLSAAAARPMLTATHHHHHHHHHHQQQPYWAKIEDEVLVSKVNELGRRWSTIASSYLPSKTPYQVRERFVQQLSSPQDHQQQGDPWGPKDIKLLREAYRRYPGNWLIISKFLGRTHVEVEDVWFSLPATL